MFDIVQAAKLFESNDLHPVGEIPIETRKAILKTLVRALDAYFERQKENPLSELALFNARPICGIFADPDLFHDLIEKPCVDAGLSVTDALTVLQFMCHEQYHHFEIQTRLWLAMRVFKAGAKRRTKKASSAAVSRWEGVNDLIESVRAEYVRDKAGYRSKADFVEVRYSELVNTHGKQRPEEGDEIGLMPTRKRFYDEWLKGL